MGESKIGVQQLLLYKTKLSTLFSKVSFQQ